MQGQEIWAARLRPADIDAAAALRTLRQVELLDLGQWLWLRGPEAPLRTLPHVEHARLDGSGRLFPRHSRLPTGRLPTEGWTPIAEALLPSRPATVLPGRLLPGPVPVVLERSQDWQPARVLRTTLAEFAAWVASTPAPRWQDMRFAAGPDGAALVRGDPPPPLPGRAHTEVERVIVPCGYRWRPAIPPPVLRDVLGLLAGESALFDETGTWARLRADDWCPVSRSAVRMTAGELGP